MTSKIRAILPCLAVLLTAPLVSARQDDPLQTHERLYQKVSPAVVFVRGGGQSGSGFFAGPGGIVVTTSTAVSESGATVQTADHKRLNATLVARIPELELAILQVPGGPYPALALGDSDRIRIGQVAYTFGDSHGSLAMDDQPAVSVGVVSGRYELKKENQKGAYRGEVIETSAAVNQNQDGGPVVDSRGRVVGMITLNYDESKFAGVAVPINRLKAEIEKALQGKAGVAPTAAKGPGWFGVEVRDAENGLEVTRVSPSGPAAKAGLKVGDVITHAGSAKVLRSQRLREIEEKAAPGSQSTLRVLRDGKSSELELTAGRKRIY